MANSIPDWKKAAIVALSAKYGYRAIGSRLDINWKTARKYQKEAEESGVLEMEGVDLKVKA